MPIVAVELLVIGLGVIVLVAVLARMTWLIAHREEGASITEEARENAAPLTTAILALSSRKHKGQARDVIRARGARAPRSRRSRNVGSSDNGGFQDAFPGRPD